MVQLSDKTAYHFVIYCLEMPQKVIVATKQPDDVKYENSGKRHNKPICT